MKKVSLIISSVVSSLLFLCCSEETTNTKMNELDTSKETVTIGNQVWMCKNLNVDKFRNGDPIPHAKTFEEWTKAKLYKKPAWSYYDNTPSNGEKYGRLYNWYAVNDPRGLAPEGWHIPSDVEWATLTDYLGDNVAGKKMKSKTGWEDEGNGSNDSGFTGLPGGFRTETAYFSLINIYSNWWSITEYQKDYSWSCYLNNKKSVVERGATHKGSGLYIRCLKD